MGNTLTARILNDYDVLVVILKTMNLKTQIIMSNVSKDFHDIIVYDIWKEKLIVDTDLIEDDSELQQVMNENSTKFKKLKVNGGSEMFKWCPFENFENLTEISLNDVALQIHHIYNMARTQANLQSLQLQNVQYGNEEVPELRYFTFNILSLKRLQLQYDKRLCRFINSCINLQELIVENVHITNIWRLQNFMLPLDEMYYQIDAIIMDLQQNVLKDLSEELYFRIIAHRNYSFSLHLQSLKASSAVLNSDWLCDICDSQELKHFSLLNKLIFCDMGSLPSHAIKMLADKCKQLQELHLDRSNIAGVVNLNLFTNLRILSISDTQICCMQLFSLLKDLALHNLKLSNCIIINGNDLPEQVENLPLAKSLKILTLIENCDFLELVLENYPLSFPNLKELNLIEMHAVNKAIKLAANNLRKLTTLNFYRCCINFDIATLPTLKSWSSLKRLKLYDCYIVRAEHIQYLLYSDSLKFLQIHGLNSDLLLNNYELIAAECSEDGGGAGGMKTNHSPRTLLMDFESFDINRIFWHSLLQKCNNLQLNIYDRDAEDVFWIVQ